MFFAGWSGIGRVIVAGTLGYLFLILVLRTSGKRTLSKMNAFDLVVTVALGSSFATLVLSKEVAVAEGAVAFALLAGLQYAVAWGSLRSGAIRSVAKSQPALLFYRGEFQRPVLRHERVTEGEIRAAVREKGIGSLSDVDAVVLETSGEFSVISRAAVGPMGSLTDVPRREDD